MADRFLIDGFGDTQIVSASTGGANPANGTIPISDTELANASRSATVDIATSVSPALGANFLAFSGEAAFSNDSSVISTLELAYISDSSDFLGGGFEAGSVIRLTNFDSDLPGTSFQIRIEDGDGDAGTSNSVLDPNFGGDIVFRFSDIQSSNANTLDFDDVVSITLLVDPGTTEASDASFDSIEVAVADIAITKTVTSVTDVNANGLDDAGDIINYEIVVDNPGGVSLTGVTVTDPLLGATLSDPAGDPAAGDLDSDGELDTDESWTYTGTYTITQDDVDSGGATADGGPADGDIDNTATVTSNETGTRSDDAEAPLDLDPQIDIVKTADQTLFAAPGTVTYTYTVTNPGNVALTNVTVEDDAFTPGDTGDDFFATYQSGDADGDGKLDVDETWTFAASYAVTQDDLDAGTDLTNIATATSTEAGPATDDETLTFDQTPGIDLVKSADQTVFSTPGDATYTYTVTNEGNVSLTNVTVMDDNFTPGDLGDDFAATFSGGDTDGDSALDVGETWTFTATYAVRQEDIDADIDLTNVATATSTEAGPVSDDETLTFVQTPGIGLTKTADQTSFDAPGTATYTYAITNEGNVSLTRVTLSDDNFTPGDTGDDFAPAFTGGDTDGDSELDVGEVWTYSATYDVTQGDLDAGNDLINIATAGSAEAGPVTDDETLSMVRTPGIALSKTADQTSFDAPGTATYTYAVSNTGNVTLTGVTLSDDNFTPGNTSDDFAPVFAGGDTDGDNELDVGEVWTYTAAYDVTQADVDAGSPLTNVATADSAETDPVTDDETLNPGGDPDVAITKIITAIDDGTEATGDGNGLLDTAGDVIEYEIEVTNTGDITLDNVLVTDPLTGLSETIAVLLPGTSETFATTYTLTQADIDSDGTLEPDDERAGRIDNTARVTDDRAGSEDDSASAILRSGDDCGCPVPPDPADCPPLVFDNDGRAVYAEYQAAYQSITGPVWTGGTPNSDNGNFEDLPVANKGNGFGGDDHIKGNDNVNVIGGGGGDDFLRGGGGDDSVYGGSGNDALLGGEGLCANDDPYGDDFLDGGSGDDAIAGQGGNDLLHGGEGDDLLIGGPGEDTALGGLGNDEIFGGHGDDTLEGGGDDDCVFGQEGDDSIAGNLGNDTLSGGTGEDTMYGYGDDDLMAGNGNGDYISGGDGNDTAFGGEGEDTLVGGDDDDQLAGGRNEDVLLGERGNDTLRGGEGHDNIRGGADNDALAGGRGMDWLEGGDNADCITGGGNADVIWGDNADGQAAQGEASDTISGGNGNDTVHGGEDDDDIRGGSGSDELHGDTGNDTVQGDQGHDAVYGGDGNDHLSGNNGRDSVDGGDGDDIIDGDQGMDALYGGDGDDCIDAGLGSDWANGGIGNDSIDGGNGHDTLDGGAGDDFIRGGMGHDAIYGDGGPDADGNGANGGIAGGGADILVGGLGHDSLYGGKETDCLLDDAGDDQMWGQGDGDDFVFGYDVDTDGDGDCDTFVNAAGDNIIHDFDDEQSDRLVLHSDYDDAGDLTATIDGNDIVVTIVPEAATIRLVDLVDDLDGLASNDDFFSDVDLLDFLLKGGVDGDGKGIIVFEDKCIGTFDCEADAAATCTVPGIDEPDVVCKTYDDAKIGNTTINTTETCIAKLYIEQDDQVSFVNCEICLDLLG